MKVADRLRVVGKEVRRKLRLSPMCNVFRRLKRRGVNPSVLNALEVFGCDGQNHTRDVYSKVAALEIWEIQPEYESILKQRFPKSRTRITDSYVEITRTPRRYDLVVVDNSYRHVILNHYEHFDLFPDVFRILSNPAVMILNVVPKAIPNLEKDTERLRQRQRFYGAVDPVDITFEEIERTYRGLAAQNGWMLEWIFFERRWPSDVYYAVLHLRRKHGE